ncbi:MAG: lactonase family protein [Pirellulales bacterium]|nr:lactonase family protein [Pirellulales bacterium]
MPTSAAERWVWFGTYTGDTSEGIYVSRFDDATGKLSEPKLAAKIASPSFLALHPNGKYLYAVQELDQYKGENSGAINAFAIHDDGTLKPLNEVTSKGAAPCQISVDKTGGTLVAANYTGGSVIAYKLLPDGSIGPESSFHQHAGSSVNPDRQKEPHAHCARLSRDQRYVLACDLGMDQVLVYELDAAAGKLTPHPDKSLSVSPGSGPRHLAFHPHGKKLYILNELLCTVTTFDWDAATATGKEQGVVSTLPAGEQRKNYMSTAEIVAHPNGKFLYASNRGHDTIAVYALDETGVPKLIQNALTGGKTPRNFNIDSSGKWLLAANQDSQSVVVFAIDPANGKLSETDNRVTVDKPVCVVFGN